jgi:acyl-homoserine-lactone acylase
LRTRLGILQIQRRLAGTDGLAGAGFNLANLQDITLSTHNYSGELAQKDVLANMCPKAGRFDTSVACASLQQWDQASNLSSIGVPVWQEFWRIAAFIPTQAWKVPFSASDPVNTPNSLDTSNPQIRKALYQAQTVVQNAGIDFNAPLGQVQQSGVNTGPGGTRIPVFGAEGDPMGVFTAAYSNGLAKDGYDIIFGNSYIQTVTWDSGGVHAEGFLTYSESTDPANPHYSDFSQAYAQKQWLRFPFHDAEIQAASESVTQLSSP